MTAPTGAFALDLPAEVLAALMDLPGPTPGSVCRRRLGDAVRLTDPILHRLAGVGAIELDEAGRPKLTPQLREACGTLSSPLSHVRVRVWQGDEGVETAVYFPDVASTRSGVGLTPVGDVLRVTTPVALPSVVDLVEQLFLSKTEAAGTPFRALLDADAARTLFGVLDWIRSGGGQVLDAGAAGPVLQFDQDEAHAHYSSRMALSTGFLFAPYLRMILGIDAGFDRTRWDRAIARLRRVGLLSKAPGGLALGSPIRILAHTSTALERGLEWSVARRVSDGSVEVVTRTILALGSRLLLSLDSDGDDLVVHTPSVAQLRADVTAVPAREEPTRRPAPFCRKCGAKRRPGKAFCASCGASLS